MTDETRTGNDHRCPSCGKPINPPAVLTHKDGRTIDVYGCECVGNKVWMLNLEDFK